MIFAFAKIGVSVQCAVFRGVVSVKCLQSQVTSRKSQERGVAQQRQPKLLTINYSLFTQPERLPR